PEGKTPASIIRWYCSTVHRYRRPTGNGKDHSFGSAGVVRVVDIVFLQTSLPRAGGGKVRATARRTLPSPRARRRQLQRVPGADEPRGRRAFRTPERRCPAGPRRATGRWRPALPSLPAGPRSASRWSPGCPGRRRPNPPRTSFGLSLRPHVPRVGRAEPLQELPHVRLVEPSRALPLRLQRL